MRLSVQSRGMYISSEPTYACRQIQVNQDKFGKFNLFCSLCSETFLHHAIKIIRYLPEKVVHQNWIYRLDILIKPNWIFQYYLRLIKHKTFQNYRPSTNNYLIIFPVSSEFCNQRWPMIWVYCYKTRIIEWNYSIYSCSG